VLLCLCACGTVLGFNLFDVLLNVDFVFDTPRTLVPCCTRSRPTCIHEFLALPTNGRRPSPRRKGLRLSFPRPNSKFFSYPESAPLQLEFRFRGRCTFCYYPDNCDTIEPHVHAQYSTSTQDDKTTSRNLLQMASIAPSQCNETTADPQVDVDTNQSEKPHDNLTGTCSIHDSKSQEGLFFSCANLQITCPSK